MATNAHSTEPCFVNSSQALEDFGLSSANFFGVGVFRLGQRADLFPKQLEIFDHEVAHRLIERPLIKRSEGFRREIFVVWIRTQSQMHLGGPLGEEAS